MASLDFLIEQMKKNGILKSERIESAFRYVDRQDFVPDSLIHSCYEDRALPIGKGQTISQPSTVAFMLELLNPLPEQKILDVGSGSCWTTALLAFIVGEQGKVIALERIEALVELGRNNLQKYQNLAVEIHHANAFNGWMQEAPYDRILVSASAKKIPQALIDQLKTGGKMVIPLSDFRGNMVMTEKNEDGTLREERHAGFAFVPFIEK